MGFWVFILAVVVAVAAAFLWLDRTAKHSSPPQSLFEAATFGDGVFTEEALYHALHAIGVDISADEVAMLSNREFDASWSYVDAMRGGSAQLTTDPPIPACLRRRGRATT